MSLRTFSLVFTKEYTSFFFGPDSREFMSSLSSSWPMYQSGRSSDLRCQALDPAPPAPDAAPAALSPSGAKALLDLQFFLCQSSQPLDIGNLNDLFVLLYYAQLTKMNSRRKTKWSQPFSKMCKPMRWADEKAARPLRLNSRANAYTSDHAKI